MANSIGKKTALKADWRYVNLHLPEELYERIRRLAFEGKTTKQDVMLDAILSSLNGGRDRTKRASQ